MMKSAEDRPSNELADPLDRPTARRILVQRQVRSAFVVIAGVGRSDPAQMALAEDNRMIKHSLRIEPISLSAYPFCQGDRGAVG